jgi:hypothetical protein
LSLAKCYVLPVMAPLKSRSPSLLLLLALILPLQGFAWVNCSSADSGPAAAHAHCQNPSGGTPAAGVDQHHHCGSCCVAAVATAPLRITPPLSANSGIPLPAHRPLLKVALDRLDRPPRLAAR